MTMTLRTRQIKDILLIEDEDDTRYLLKLELSTAGYKVRSAVDRDEALQLFKDVSFQVILIDFCMAGASLENFVAFARQKCGQTKIVLMSASTKAASVAAQLGIDYICKPFVPVDLLAFLDGFEQKKDAACNSISAGANRGLLEVGFLIVPRG